MFAFFYTTAPAWRDARNHDIETFMLLCRATARGSAAMINSNSAVFAPRRFSSLLVASRRFSSSHEIFQANVAKYVRPIR